MSEVCHGGTTAVVEDDPVAIYRDAFGIPHVRADSVLAVARDQGRACAQDRLWQIAIDRMRGEGRVAEWFGEAGLEWDTFARRAGLADVAQRGLAGLDDESRAFVAAYVDGVNDVIGRGASAPELDDLGVRVEPWPEWAPLVVFLAQHVLFGPFPGKLFRHRVRATLPEALPLFRTEGLTGGSNAFVVGSARTHSGFPLVAGDPHRTFETPNVYSQVRLACPEFDVVGFTFPGVPGVQHFAHAGSVAWGITNAAADYQDLYAEQLDRRGEEVFATGPRAQEPVERHTETITVRNGEPVEVEVLVTERGPVILGGPEEAEAISLRTPSWVLGDLGFGALLPLLRARTVADVDAALDAWVEPVNNVVVADAEGTALHRVAGVVPARPPHHRRLPVPAQDGDAWTGWVHPLPRNEVSEDSCFVTANQRKGPAYDVLGDDFAASFRADRIQQLLEHGEIGVDRAMAVLADVHQNAGQSLLARIGQLDGLSSSAEKVRAELLAWDGTMAPDDPTAGLFGAVRAALVDRIVATPAVERLGSLSPYGPLFAPWFSVATRVAVSLHVWLAADHPLDLDLDELVRESLEEVAATGATTWGERHVFHPFHAREMFGLPHESTTPATPMPGDNDAVFAAGWLPGTSLCARGPVARYVWDLSDRDRSRWAVPMGASGTAGHPHQLDQHQPWVAGSALPVTNHWAELTEQD